MIKDCILGIDTSNYRTSIAVVDQKGTILKDHRSLLKVKQGERGLRQSEALFQHIENLPILFEELNDEQIKVVGVAVADKPRPLEGSYMPCFKAGYGFGKAIANTLQVPLFQFSHQEGHIEAVKHYSDLKDVDSFLAWHLSGGTCELLQICKGQIEIIGGSKDLSFGQVIDRIGVLMGMSFPAGAEMDFLALQAKATIGKRSKGLSKIKRDDLYFNLSGIETQCSRLLKKQRAEGEGAQGQIVFLIEELFEKLSESIIGTTEAAVAARGEQPILFAGGVSCSEFISSFENSLIPIAFGRQDLAGDNAVGIALLGGKHLWQ